MIGKNNPLNIRYVKRNNWKGQVGSTRGFCDFVSVEYCVRAFAILVLRSYKKRGIVTISQIISTYAPPSENQTDKYIDYVCEMLGCFPFDVLDNDFQLALLIVTMSRFESSTLLDLNVVHLMLIRFGFTKKSYYE